MNIVENENLYLSKYLTKTSSTKNLIREKILVIGKIK